MLKENETSNIGLTDFPLINAVIEKQQEGKIYKLAENYFILHKAGFCYYSFKEKKNIQGTQMLQLIAEDKTIPDYIHIYDATQELAEEAMKDVRFNAKVRTRIQLKFTSGIVEATSMPAGYYMEPIREDNFMVMEVFGLDIDSKFWKSQQDFLRFGFGYCIFNEKRLPLSVCYTACVVNNEAEIDVITRSGFLQKGLAKAAVAAFTNHCIGKNIIANWDCFEENIGSLKTAESLGFKTTRKYSFLSIYKKKLNEKIIIG